MKYKAKAMKFHHFHVKSTQCWIHQQLKTPTAPSGSLDRAWKELAICKYGCDHKSSLRLPGRALKASTSKASKGFLEVSVDGVTKWRPLQTYYTMSPNRWTQWWILGDWSHDSHLKYTAKLHSIVIFGGPLSDQYQRPHRFHHCTKLCAAWGHTACLLRDPPNPTMNQMDEHGWFNEPIAK